MSYRTFRGTDDRPGSQEVELDASWRRRPAVSALVGVCPLLMGRPTVEMMVHNHRKQSSPGQAASGEAYSNNTSLGTVCLLHT